MTFYVDCRSRLIGYSNRDDTILNVDILIKNALDELGFTEVKNIRNYNGRLLLVIWHGDFPPQLSNQEFKSPIVLVRMSSQGISGRPQILNDRIGGIYEPFYPIQGGASSTKIPASVDQWKKLIEWLLSIEKSEWAASDEPSLPSDGEIRKFIYTEPYPDELLSYYLAAIAKRKGVDLTLSDEVMIAAKEDFDKLSTKYYKGKKTFDHIEDLRSIFQKISEECVQK